MDGSRRSLKNLNTFGVEAYSKSFIKLNSEEELLSMIRENKLSGRKHLILGGGSNVLFTKDFDGTIIHPGMNAISIRDISEDSVSISCDAGLEWDSFVEYCVNNNYGGVENLSYIPGNIGAAPIQNIGAYGVEVKDCIESVRTVDLVNGNIRIFDSRECEFGYRWSIFKGKLKGRYLISSVLFRLSPKPGSFSLGYGNVNERVLKKGTPTLKTIRETIIEIRKEKLPDPELIGNAGSFFKNPVLKSSHFESLLKSFPDIPSYPAENKLIKIPAAWLIEKCGWKGYIKGDAGVHEKQALVLVNYGNASGKEIYQLSEEIIKSVRERFGIKLEREVNIV